MSKEAISGDGGVVSLAWEAARTMASFGLNAGICVKRRSCDSCARNARVSHDEEFEINECCVKLL